MKKTKGYSISYSYYDDEKDSEESFQIAYLITSEEKVKTFVAEINTDLKAKLKERKEAIIKRDKKISILNKKKSKLKPGSIEFNDVHKEINNIYRSDVDLYKFDNGLISFCEDFYKLENTDTECGSEDEDNDDDHDDNINDDINDDNDVFYYSEIEILQD